MKVKTAQNINSWIHLFICLFNQPPSHFVLRYINNLC